MESHGFLGLLGLLLGVAFAAEEIFRRFRIPPALVLMGTGVLVGPVLELVAPARFLEVAPHFGALAFLLILLEGGLDLDLDRTLGSLAPALRIAAAGFFGAWAIGMLLARLHGVPWRGALLVGLVLAPLSGAILIPLLGRLGLPPLLRTALIVEAALADVLGVIGLALAEQLLEPAGWETLLAFGTLLAAVASILAGALLGFAWPIAARSLGERDYVDVLTFGVALALWGAVSAIGAPGALAVLAFGLTLANEDSVRAKLRLPGVEEARHRGRATALHAFIGQLNFLVRAFFFVFLGIVVRLGDLSWVTGSLALTVVLASLAVRRYLVPRALAPLAGVPVALLVAMQPRGLVSAVLAIEAEHLGVTASVPLLAVVSLVIVATNLVLAFGLVRWGGSLPGSAPEALAASAD